MVHGNEEVDDAVIYRRSSGTCRWSYRLNVRVSSAGRFRLPKLAELADWGENSTGDISVASGTSCLFPITMRGTVNSSDIMQKPAHGKLKKINVSTYEYKAKARYKGSDTFVIKATGQGPATSGTSVITVNATIK